MSPQQALEKYRTLVVVNGGSVAEDLGLALRDAPAAVKAQSSAINTPAGNLVLFRHPTKHLDKVLEVVVSATGKDSISSVYIGNTGFLEDVGRLIWMRQDLIAAVAAKIGLPPESVGIEDAARGRTLGLVELSTGQLIDMLAEKEGAALVGSDNLAGGLLVD